MSYAIRAAKAGNMGDPGLFSFVGKAVKGIGGALVGGAKGLLKGGVGGALRGAVRGGARAVMGNAGRARRGGGGAAFAGNMAYSGAATDMTASMVPLQFQAPPRSGGFMPGTGIQFNTPLGGAALGTFQGGAAPGAPATMIGPNGNVCRGHMNRSGYYTSQGYVPPGAKCVPNRRMNPLNPRALNKAMRRIVSAKKAANFLNKIHFGNKPRAASAARSCGGGCRKK